MDSDMMNMMMQQIEKLPDFCNPNSNPNSHNILSPTSLFPPDHAQPNEPMISTTHPLFFNPTHIPSDPNYGSGPLPASSSSSFPAATAYPSILLDKRNSNNNNNNSNNMAAMREMIFRIAVMQPIHIDPEAIKPPKRRNVRISKDPQSVAARHRRERISERIRILQRLVPGGTKMDTASMLDEAIHYVKFLKKQVQSLEEQAVANSSFGGGRMPMGSGMPPLAAAMVAGVGGGGGTYGGGHGVVMKGCGGMGSSSHRQMVGNVQMLR